MKIESIKAIKVKKKSKARRHKPIIYSRPSEELTDLEIQIIDRLKDNSVSRVARDLDIATKDIRRTMRVLSRKKFRFEAVIVNYAETKFIVKYRGRVLND